MVVRQLCHTTYSVSSADDDDDDDDDELVDFSYFTTNQDYSIRFFSIKE